MTWALVNVEARAELHRSFEIPSRAERANLCVGNLAKLVFVDLAMGHSPSGERMWVEIVAVAVEGGLYRGQLQNTPALIQALAEGDLVDFGPEHVADWGRSDWGSIP